MREQWRWPSDNRTFQQRNLAHDAAIPWAIRRFGEFGIDTKLSGTEQLGSALNQQIRTATRDGPSAECRYFPDLWCRVRATDARFCCEIKTGYRAQTGNCAVEWAAYQAQSELAQTGLRVVWLFDTGAACWIQDIMFCSPIYDGVQQGRTPFRLVKIDHDPAFRPLEQFLYEEFGCQPE